MRFETSIFVGFIVAAAACAEPPIPAVPPVTSARVIDAPQPGTASTTVTSAVHPLRASLATDGATVFLLFPGEKGDKETPAKPSSCERATVKDGDKTGEKPGRRLLEIDASSTSGCWSGKASVVFALNGDHADVTETRVYGSYMGHATRCVAPVVLAKGETIPPNVETVSDGEIKIEGTRIFADEAACKAALASPPQSAKEGAAPTGCIAKGLSAAIGARKPPPAGPFVDRFEKLLKSGGTVWTPSETQKNVCVANQLASKAETVKNKDMLRVTLTTNSVEQGTKWVDVSTYEYDPACKRSRFNGVSGDGINPDGSRSGRAGSAMGNASDLHEHEDAKDALPLATSVFYTQAGCLAYAKANPPTP